MPRAPKRIAPAVVVNKMQQNQSSRARAEEKTEAINLVGDADWRQGEGGN